MEEKEMKLTDVEKSNILICEFMGGKYNGIYDVEINGVSDYIGVLKYHTSWDWLMPVVEKIESMGYDTHIHAVGQNNEPIIYAMGIESWNAKSICSESDRDKIVCVYKTVTAFIQWYNSTPNK